MTDNIIKQNNTKTSSKSIIIETIMFFTYAFFAVNWIAGSTLTPQIMEHFHLEGFASATLISNAITIAKIIGNFMAAAVLNRLLLKKSIALGSLLIVLGSVVAIFAPSYTVFIIGRFIMGFGGALYVVYLSPIVIKYFSPETRPTVNALNSVAYNVGSIIALVIVGPVIAWLQTWQYSMGFFAAISGILFILWMIVGEDVEIEKKENSDELENNYTLVDAMKEKINWLLPLSYSGLLTFYLVLLNIFPISGFAVIDAKSLSTLTAIGGVIGTIIAIALSKKYHKRLPVIRVCGLLMSLSGLIMFKATNGVVASIAALAIGIFMFTPMTSLVMIPQELPNMTPSKLTQVMGLFWAISYIIETTLYFIIGNIIDLKGYGAGLNLALIASLTFFLGSFLLPETGKNKN
ncbi:CynX/NimT family MFS transporter [Peptoniphilus stercorisuis]|uniref:MFS family permease n=1 Tax=Peptoniphilus stercorisuis TaxID=1436965 RepID=A0ABS4KDP4_9FIRM|nr:MFS transporter [Peptoniphilus stercorisuis]MBP2025291.1 MFS family permease [Peptoniphilus stercorisuis]